MKLLKKSEILSLKEIEKKKTIEEGLLIANRIDSLRETYAQEEKSLLDFRNATVKTINEDITKLSEEKGSLLFQVEKLKVERAELMKPVEQEWIDIAEAHKELSEKLNVISTKETEVVSKISELDNQIKANNNLKRKLESLIEQKQREYGLFLNEQFSQREDRETLNTFIKDNKAVIENVLNDLKRRDIELAIKEKQIQIKEESLVQREKQIVKDTIRLKDRLQRAEKIIGKYKK